MIDVLIAEDSAVAREHLLFLLREDPAFGEIRSTTNGAEAVAEVRRKPPHVVLMDINMPVLDGIEATRQIMSTAAVPIVVVTASTAPGDVSPAMRAMEAGALAVLAKPRALGRPEGAAEASDLLSTIKLMAEVKVVRRWPQRHGAVPGPPTGRSVHAAGGRIERVAIGASTGGPQALQRVLAGLPPGFPCPVLVVQHITSGFTAGFVAWLAEATGRDVRLAAPGLQPEPGRVYVAPDGRHLVLTRDGELGVSASPPHAGLRPSAGVLFRSLTEVADTTAAVLLSGMGQDGAPEMRELAERGALTIAQDAASSVVHGMPGAAIALGAAQHVLCPEAMAELLSDAARRRRVDGGRR